MLLRQHVHGCQLNEMLFDNLIPGFEYLHRHCTVELDWLDEIAARLRILGEDNG